MSKINQLITDYEKQQEQIQQHRQELARQIYSKQIDIIKNILGEEVFAELAPHAKKSILQWNGNQPEFEFPFSGEPLGVEDFTLWVADHGNFELGIIYFNSGTKWLNKNNMGEIFKEMRCSFEEQRQAKHQETMRTLVGKLENPRYHQNQGMTDEEARLANAELRTLDPDRAPEWDDLLKKWLQFRTDEALRLEKQKQSEAQYKADEEKRHAEYEQLKANFEEKYRSWFAKFLKCKKENIKKAENYQKSYLDQLGKPAGFILKYGIPNNEGVVEINTVYALDKLSNGIYRVIEDGQIKTVRYYNPISLQPIELTPDDRTWWLRFTQHFGYGYYDPHYQIAFYYRPGIDPHTALSHIKFADPGRAPDCPELEYDYYNIIGKVAAENEE